MLLLMLPLVPVPHLNPPACTCPGLLNLHDFRLLCCQTCHSPFKKFHINQWLGSFQPKKIACTLTEVGPQSLFAMLRASSPSEKMLVNWDLFNRKIKNLQLLHPLPSPTCPSHSIPWAHVNLLTAVQVLIALVRSRAGSCCWGPLPSVWGWQCQKDGFTPMRGSFLRSSILASSCRCIVPSNGI